MTNVLVQEFFNIFMIVEYALLNRFLKGRSQSYRIALADMLFILLKALKSGAIWQFSATLFKIPVDTFRKPPRSIVETIADSLHDHAVVAVE